MRVVVIHYDGNDWKASLGNPDYPDSAQAHMHDLPPDHDVIAVVVLPQEESDPVQVYIKEELTTLEG